MAVSRRCRTGRVTTIAAAVSAAALTIGLAGGCDTVHKALDCVQTAETIADSVTDLQQAVENAANDPARAGAALDSIEQNLKKIGDKTSSSDVNKAVDDLDEAVGTVRADIKNGDRAPDVKPVTQAAGELTKVCTR
ncbi:hypothetical protein LK07_12250 [Streptomyces pluripotens]|uniref:Secreted protein n=1 Tax=Streptomyces pluripotens TaxID=1355015 RepID=A0A221NXZ0_9ACTN|nr:MULTISPECIES: hypothetical protein [Streptomyces]ARP70422.1 hypothetical protein LK06_011130 [Streptomyces pluripotens]ASN24678.1 hypothetical protein LK07_12250 [Streptomyces pluripotens]MCH0558835.1 hypothetical protein [Streptomyces sp. MUM 16J]